MVKLLILALLLISCHAIGHKEFNYSYAKKIIKYNVPKSVIYKCSIDFNKPLPETIYDPNQVILKESLGGYTPLGHRVYFSSYKNGTLIHEYIHYILNDVRPYCLSEVSAYLAQEIYRLENAK